MNEIYPYMTNGKFLEIPEVYKRDRLEIQLLLLENLKRRKSAHVAILGQRLSNESVTLDVGYNDMEPSRGHGYWRPRVRKHGFFNVTSFEKLNFDREWAMSSSLLWHISAPK